MAPLESDELYLTLCLHLWATSFFFFVCVPTASFWLSSALCAPSDKHSLPSEPEDGPNVTLRWLSVWSCCYSEWEWGREQAEGWKGFSYSWTYSLNNHSSKNGKETRDWCCGIQTLRLKQLKSITRGQYFSNLSGTLKKKEEKKISVTSEEKIASQHAFLMFETTKGLQKGSNIVFLFWEKTDSGPLNLNRV